MTTLFRAPAMFVTAALTLAFSSSMREGQRALVYCPIDVDAAGCTAVMNALTEGGDFTGGVDRGYTGADGTVDLRGADLSVYSVVVIPSLADDATDHPYALLRDPAVAARIRGVLTGRQVFFSGTPDQGTAPETRQAKNALIRNLAHWASARFGVAKGPGLVALQDQSEDAAARYSWARAIVGYSLVAHTSPSTYSRLQALTPAAREILNADGALLSYGNIASFGFSLPDGDAGVRRDAFSQTGGDLVLVTFEGRGANTQSAGPANSGFAFLPPLGAGTANPSTFDASATPVVEVCAWSGTSCSAAPIARFATAPAGSDLPLTVNATDGRFEAPWNLLNSAFTTRRTYRIRVLRSTTELGAVSVDVVRGRWALTRSDGTLAPLVSANTLPIWFTLVRETDSNHDPVATITAPTAGASFAEGQPITFTGRGDDVDEPLSNSSLEWTSNVAGAIGTGPNVTVSTLAAGPHTITLEVTDSHGATGTTSINITVVANQPPTAQITQPASGTVVNQGQSVAFAGSGTDPEDNALTGNSLVWTSDRNGQIGTGTTFNTSSLIAGTHVITLTATDSKGLTGTAPVTLVVNGPPVAVIDEPLAGASVPAGQAITFKGHATDADDTQWTYEWSSNVAGVLGTTANVTVNNLAAGPHTITLEVTDSHGAAGTTSINITVVANQPPTAFIDEPANDASFPAGQAINFKGRGTDPENGQLTFSWSSNLAGALGNAAIVTVNNLAAGPHTITLTVTDPQGATGTTSISVLILRTTLSVPANLSVPFGSTASLPIQLTDLAPAGGVTFTVTSGTPAIAEVQTQTVTIPAGGQLANATIFGSAPGSATIQVSAPGYVPVTTQVAVQASLNIVEGTASFASGRTAQLTVRLERSGSPIAAPTGGLQVTLTPTNPNCVAVTSPVTIPAGLVSTTATVSYGGSASLPCTTTVAASATGIPEVTTDNVSVSVQPSPAITFSNFAGNATHVGAGLRQNLGGFASVISLGAPAPAGGLPLTLTSSDGNLVGVALSTSTLNITTASAPSATITVPAGQTQAWFAFDGMEGTTGTVTFTVSAPGYTSATSTTVRVHPLALNLSVTTPTTTLSPNTSMTALVCYANDAGTDAASCGQPIRPGGTPISVAFTNSASAVGQLVVIGGATGQTATATIAVGATSTPSGVTGGVQFDPLGPGTASIGVTSPGLIAGPSATRSITVTGPAITFSNFAGTPANVGAGLRQNPAGSGSVITLGAPAPAGGLQLTLTSSDGNLVGVALSTSTPTITTASAPSATITVPAGQTQSWFSFDGMEGTTGTVTFMASAPGYTSATSTTVRVHPLALNLTVSTPTTTLSPNSSITTRVCYANDAETDAAVCTQAIRPGGTPISVSFSNSASTVGQLVVIGGATGQTATATIAVGAISTPSGVTGGVQFDPLGAGTSNISVTSPGLIAGPSATRSITVNAPLITFSNFSGTPAHVGAGLRQNLAGFGSVISLGAPAPAGGLPLTLTSSDGNLVRVALSTSSPNITTASAAAATITVPAGQTQAWFSFDGMEGTTGTVTFTASAPGYTSATSTTVRVHPLALSLNVSTPTTTLSPNTSMTALVCYANDAETDAASCGQAIRPGGTPIPVSFTNSASAVGQLVVIGGATGQTATATIAVGATSTPSGVTGGVQFDPLGAGTSNVSVTSPGLIIGPSATRSINVTTPTIVFSPVSGTVNAGQRLACQQVTLQAPAPAGTILTLTSSNGSVLQLASNPGCGAVDGPVGPTATITLAANQTIVFFSAHGQDQGGTVIVTATAPGYVDGTRSFTVVAP